MPENERTDERRRRPRCGDWWVDESDNGWLCERPRGHKGMHQVVLRWAAPPPQTADPEIWAKCFDGRTCEQPEACHDALRCLRATPESAEVPYPGWDEDVWLVALADHYRRVQNLPLVLSPENLAVLTDLLATQEKAEVPDA